MWVEADAYLLLFACLCARLDSLCAVMNLTNCIKLTDFLYSEVLLLIENCKTKLQNGACCSVVMIY